MLRPLLYSVLAFVLFCPLAQAEEHCYRTMAEASQHVDESSKEGMLALEVRGQRTITCKGREYLIPPTFVRNSPSPTAKTNECLRDFYNIGTSSCTVDSFYIEHAGSPYCNGTHVCSFGEFHMTPITSSLAHEQLLKILPTHTKVVQLHDGVQGYLQRGYCAAYCNKDKIYWEADGKMFTLSSGESEEWLAKAANDYIDAAKAFRQAHSNK